MSHARTLGRRWWLMPLLVVLGLVATGCDTGIDGLDGDGSGPATKPVTSSCRPTQPVPVSSRNRSMAFPRVVRRA